MIRLKKPLSFLLAAVLIVGAGCGKAGGPDAPASTATPLSSSTASPEAKSLYNVGSLPIVNEPVTLKVLTQNDTGRPFSSAGDAGLWKWLEEKTGITLAIESYSAEEVKTKIPLIMASNDLPDLFFRCDITDADMMNYGKNGQVLIMNNYIENLGTNIKACFEALDYAYGASVSPDGNIYSLPSFNGSKAMVTYSINDTWLKNLNLDTPTTMEELYTVLKASLENDANKNGKKDELGIGGEPKSFKRMILSWVGLNSYWPWEGALFDAAGDKVFFVETTDQYKYLLSEMAKFYEEGLIDPELFTQTTDETKAKRLSNAYGLFSGVPAVDESPDYRFESFTPITSKVSSEPLIISGAPYQTNIGAVAATTKYPEVAMLLIDYLFSEEASQIAFWGIEGVDYTVDTSFKDAWVITAVNKDYGNADRYLTAMLVPRWNRDKWVQPPTTEGGRLTAERQQPYAKIAFQNYLKFTDEESEKIATIATDLGSYLDQMYIGFITGEYDVESYWDTYVAQVKAMKADELTDVYQTAYNRYYGLD